MVKNKEESKDCKEMKLKDKKNKGGYKELKDPLTGKGKRHTASAMKKDADAVSNEVAVEHKEETTVAQEAEVSDFEKKGEVPDKDKKQLEESVILRYKDSDKFPDAVFQFEEQKNITVPLDFDEDSFIVGVSKEIGTEFQGFMKEKGLEEMPNVLEIDAKIAEVQNSRSKSALDKDNSITAQKVGKKENPEDLNSWLAHPNLSDLENIDTATEKKTVS